MGAYARSRRAAGLERRPPWELGPSLLSVSCQGNSFANAWFCPQAKEPGTYTLRQLCASLGPVWFVLPHIYPLAQYDVYCQEPQLRVEPLAGECASRMAAGAAGRRVPAAPSLPLGRSRVPLGGMFQVPQGEFCLGTYGSSSIVFLVIANFHV